jgi:hypothetical protein
MNCNYKEDNEWSKKQNHLFDKWYKTEEFAKLLSKLRLKGKVEIKRIDRSENPLFQSMTYLDAVIELSTGSSLLIDEKAMRWKPYLDNNPSYANNFAVEVCSNPTGKKDGWAYHEGIVVVHARINKDETGFYNSPLVYRISQNFINDIVRGKKFETNIAPKTNGLYNSIYKWVPREELEVYWP